MENRTLKQLQDEKFNWLKPTLKDRRISRADVSISLCSLGQKRGNKKAIYLTVRNDKQKNLGEWVDIAVYKNRVMFRRASGAPAMHLLGNKNSPNFYARINDDECVNLLKPFIGDYVLEEDKFYELCFIERDDTVQSRETLPPRK